MRHIIVTFGVLAVFGLAGCVKRGPATDVKTFKDGEQVNLVLPRWPDRSAHDLASDRGNVVLLDIWATWCDPCRDALPVYQQFAQQYGPKGLRVYAVNMDEDPRLIEPFLQQVKVDLPVLLEQEGKVEHSLGIRMMPSSLILDRQGRLRFRHEGFSEDSVAKYRSEIEQLLAEP